MTQVEFDERAALPPAKFELQVIAPTIETATFIGTLVEMVVEVAEAHREAALKLAHYAHLLDDAPTAEFAGGVVAGELRKLSESMQDYLSTFTPPKGVSTCSDPA